MCAPLARSDGVAKGDALAEEVARIHVRAGVLGLRPCRHVALRHTAPLCDAPREGREGMGKFVADLGSVVLFEEVLRKPFR